MTFTKEDLKAELRVFMLGFARSVERMFVPGCGAAMLGLAPGTNLHDVVPEQIDSTGNTSTLWCTVLSMYDFGIQGLRVPGSLYGARADGHSQIMDADECDVEMFLTGLESLELYFLEDAVPRPELAIRTVLTAAARHVLEGGARDVIHEGQVETGYLTFQDVALLADMDERSVRNAANPKLPDPLVTESFGKRTVIAVGEARRWLAGRKGFVPTRDVGALPKAAPDPLAATIPRDLQVRIKRLAEGSDVGPWDLLRDLLDKHEKEIAGQTERGA